MVVINVLVSKEPNVIMPDWDEGYRNYAYSSGVQNLEHAGLGEWMVGGGLHLFNSRGPKQGAHITTEVFTLVALNKKVPRLFCAMKLN